jgi:hypothetical protein
MKYKPFDHELFSLGHPVQFRNGQTKLEVYYSAIRASGNYPPVISIDSSGIHRFHMIDGRLIPEDNGNGFDVVMMPKEVEYWVATGKIINEQSSVYTSLPVENEQEAIEQLVNDLDIDNTTIQTHKIIRYE